MAVTDTTSPGRSYLEWGPVFAGAIAAASLSFLLLTFGGAIGLSLTSPWPGSGTRLWVVALAIAWWMVLVQIGSFAAGGYLAGRLRSQWNGGRSAEGGFRDSTHGLMVWAVGVLMGAALLALLGLSTAKTAAQSASVVAAGATSGVAKSAVSVNPADYAVDLLLRPQPSQAARPAGTDSSAGGDEALRSETNRIFSGAIKNRALIERDRNYLTQVVVSRSGLSEADAQKRVDIAVMEAQNLENKVRDEADKARRATIITALMAAMSLLISLAAATTAAAAGGRHRDENRIPTFAGHRFW